MPNRKKWIRYVLYAVEILLLFLLQDTPGLLPQIMGVKPLPVLSAALTIAMVEACTPAMAFGMYAGFLADIGSGAVFGYHALTFGVLCFLLSGLCGTRIQIQLFTSVLMGLWSCAVAVLLDWLVLYVAAGYSLTLYALVTKYLPIYFYTLLTIPVCYGLQAWCAAPYGGAGQSCISCKKFKFSTKGDDSCEKRTRPLYFLRRYACCRLSFVYRAACPVAAFRGQHV